VNTVMNLGVPYKAGNFLTSWVTVSFSRTPLHGVRILCLKQKNRFRVHEMSFVVCVCVCVWGG
jgi:hypothetical protein